MEYATPVKSTNGKYLFCYFLGNEPEEERICMAVSKDGYHFKPLNSNKPIIKQTKGTLCMRDPFVVRDKECFYIVATDMKSSDGWCSNHGVISWKSNDLINWYDETAVDFHDFEETKTTDKTWAPEAIWDEDANAFMVYYSIRNEGVDDASSIWYSHTKDFKTYTAPKRLFAPSSKLDAIDADIIKKGDKYYMYYKDEYNKTICGVYADKLTGPYIEYDNNVVACTDRNAEGNCIYKIAGTDTYVMIMDMYSDGEYFMQQTEDMIHFKPVAKEDFTMNFSPRHGSMLHITDDEYDRLVAYYGF